jgi:carboxypeptidase family protein
MRSRFSHCAILGAPLVWYFTVCPAVAQQASSELLDLRGKVVNSVTGEPIGGALVQVFAPGQRVQFTRADGTFAFADLPAGSYQPSAQKPGFFNDLEPQRPLVTPLMATSGNEQIILKLTPEAIIYGEVKNENDQPLEGVIVRAQQWRVQNGQRQLATFRDAATNDEGNFRLADLRPGRYYLSFPSTNNGGWSTTYGLSSKRHEEEGYAAQFYPGVPDLESASVIEIRGGAKVHIMQALSPQHLFEVAGVVRGADPESGFNVTLTNSMGDMVQKRVRMDPKTGQFQILGVPEGTYLLQATANRRPALRNTASGLLRIVDEDRPPLTATLPLHVQGDVSGLVVVLGMGISIAVQLRDETSDGGGTNVQHQVSLQLTPLEFLRSPSWITVPQAPGERRGPTRFDGLAPGVYSLSATPHGPWYIASMRCGNVDLLREDLTVAQGAVPPIEVTLQDDGAQLTVRILEKGQPAAAGVALFSEDYPKRSLFFASTSSFSIGNLAPGTYYVIAVRNANDLEFRNPTAMQRYFTHATEVTLGPRANTTTTAEVQDGENSEQ